MPNFYDFSVPTRKSGELKTSELRGKVVLVVNTATGCAFTPQYAPIEEMYRKYHDKGLEILDIPCNQFLGQAPGSDDEIHDFCTLHYNTTFEQMKKADVNGENALPLYAFLKSRKGFEGLGQSDMARRLKDVLDKVTPGWEDTPDVKWNFTKFLVDRSGEVVARFEPTADMAEVEKAVLKLL